ncbi:MAG: hypothetical protein ILO68_06670, partial [Clostridia bacterium]|nr:hypothetical protein [Clostridia bacterium]
SSLGYGPRFSDTAYARVYPGQYMQFFLIFGDRLDNRIYWTTNLLYIPEEAGAQSLPFELLSYKTLFLDKAFKETGTEYQYSTADDLNRTIRGTSTDRRFWENMTFRPNGSPEAFQAWANGREIVYTPVLYGPDFVLIGADFRTRDLPKDGISQFKLSFPALWDTIQSYSGRDPAGYRAGEYALIVFIDGALAGGYRINLQ